MRKRFDFWRLQRGGRYHCPGCAASYTQTHNLGTHFDRTPACAAAAGWTARTPLPPAEGQPRRGRAPGSAWPPERRTAFFTALAETRNPAAAAKALGVDVSTTYHFRKRDPEFAAAWDAALGLDEQGRQECGIDGCTERWPPAALASHQRKHRAAPPAPTTEHRVQSEPRRGRTLHKPSPKAQDAPKKPRAPRTATPRTKAAHGYIQPLQEAPDDVFALVALIIRDGHCPCCTLPLDLHPQCTNCPVWICPEELAARDIYSDTYTVCIACAEEAAGQREWLANATPEERASFLAKRGVPVPRQLPAAALRREGSRWTGPETPLPLKKAV